MPDPREPNVSGAWIVLPTYCEAENLAAVIGSIDASVPGINIVVVDDNSPDGTAELARSLAVSRPRLYVVSRPAKTGLGDAYLAGFGHASKAGAELVLTMDCDLSHSPAAIPGMLAALGNGRCVVGSRYTEGGRISNWTFDRRLLSWTANRFVRTLFRLPVADCTSGFRVYRRGVVDALIRRQTVSQGYSFLVEALTIAVDGPGSVVEIPIHFVDRVAGDSKMGVREIFGGARSLIRLWLRARSGSVDLQEVYEDHE